MRAGVPLMTSSTLLAKDTSHRNVFPVFAAGAGLGLPEMEGAGNFVMVADPTTFRVLPWASGTGWVLCDIYFPNGKPVPFSTRALYRDAVNKLGNAGFDYCAGLEVEFHLFKIADLHLDPARLTWPAEAPAVIHTTHGFQYLTETRFDQAEPVLDELRKVVQALDLPLRSLEVELGPSQFEFTFAPERGLAPADTMVLFRSAMKQAARRLGHIISFMCRPRLPNAFASGWHLHQSLIERKSKANAFVSRDERQILSPLGQHFLAGVLAHARAAAAFTTPTLNGYSRYRGVNSMAPIQAIWASDNRGVMMRVLGEPRDPAMHLENRVGEPLASIPISTWPRRSISRPRRRIAQAQRAVLAADTPYQLQAEPLPVTLADALDTLDRNECLRSGFGDVFVDYYLAIKRAEIARAEISREGCRMTAASPNGSIGSISGYGVTGLTGLEPGAASPIDRAQNFRGACHAEMGRHLSGHRADRWCAFISPDVGIHFRRHRQGAVRHLPVRIPAHPVDRLPDGSAFNW